jgi:hypothetical protein
MKQLFLWTAVSLLACNDIQPCASASQCPQLVGTFLMSWENAVNNSCGRSGPRPQVLIFTQSISSGGTVIDGIRLGGSIYDTNQFTMTGGAARQRFSLSGTVVPASTVSDGGTRIVGALTSSLSNDAGLDCQVTESYVGDKVTR